MPRLKSSTTQSKIASNGRPASPAAAMDDVYKKPGYLFRRMQQIAVAIFMDECKSVDLTPVQYAALVAIRSHPGIDATRLSALIAFDRSTLGSVIERLEAKGLLERMSGPDDKRVKLLYLTKSGASELHDVEPLVSHAQTRMLATLKPADRKIFLTLMKQLVDRNKGSSRAPLRPERAIRHPTNVK